MGISDSRAAESRAAESFLHAVSILILSGAVISSLGCEEGTQPETRLLGMATDPLGDMPRRGADLVSGQIEVIGGEVFISIRWAPGTFVRDTSRVTLHLDTDENPLTGSRGINATHTVDADMIGSEFMFKFGATGRSTDITHYAFSDAGWNVQDLGCCVSYSGDGVDIRFPLGLLGDDDGFMAFKMVSAVDVEPGGFSGWLDVMPDVGLPAARVESG
jgi:hypothetical protein